MLSKATAARSAVASRSLAWQAASHGEQNHSVVASLNVRRRQRSESAGSASSSVFGNRVGNTASTSSFCRNVSSALGRTTGSSSSSSGHGYDGIKSQVSNFFSRECQSPCSSSSFSPSSSSPLSSRSFSSSASVPRAASNAEGEAAPEFAWPDSNRPRVCILGGGFGGLYTALRLESLSWSKEKKPQVVVVDQSDRFVFKPMLYEILAKEVDIWEVAPRFSDLLSGSDVIFLKDTVASISPGGGAKASVGGTAGSVLLNSGTELTFDWLVLALGAEPRLDFAPGAAENALPFSTLQDALRVESSLVALERERFGSYESRPILVSVVGAGYSGVELACAVAQRLGSRGRVQIIDPAPTVCPVAADGSREAASKMLDALGVEVRLSQKVKAIRKSTSADNSREFELLVELPPPSSSAAATGAAEPQVLTVPSDLVLWTVGIKPLLPPEAATSSATATSASAAPENGGSSSSPSFPRNGRGQAEVEATLRVRGYPQIFALGDSAGAFDSQGKLLPATAQVAFQQADYVGWNIWASINSKPLLPFRYQHLGEMMRFGTGDASISVGFLDNVTLEGPLAHTARKLAYLYRLPTNEHRLRVGASWFAKSALDAVAFVQDSISKVTSTR